MTLADLGNGLMDWVSPARLCFQFAGADARLRARGTGGPGKRPPRLPGWYRG